MDCLERIQMIRTCVTLFTLKQASNSKHDTKLGKNALVAPCKAWLTWRSSLQDPINKIIWDHQIKKSTSTKATSSFQDFSRPQESLSGLHHNKEQGLGIMEFLCGKNLLITGGSGLLAKALVEKILRVQPDVGQIFLLLRPKYGNSKNAKLLHEVVKCDLFRSLQEIHGSSYEEFIEQKLTIIKGDITLKDLGIDSDTMRKIKNQIHIIVNSAATTNFNARYDDALLTNTIGAKNVTEFSKLISSLQLVMHVSTAYVNGHKEGCAHESPLTLEEVYPLLCNEGRSEASFYIEQEEKIVQLLKVKPSSSQQSLDLSLRDLGMERATIYGSHNTYVFTKTLGEALISEARDGLPLVILRPSIITSTIKEPFDGWIQGCRMVDPIITAYAKGQIHGFVGAHSTIGDLIPLDMVVNSMLAMITKHAGNSGLEVYHTTSSSINPVSFEDIMKFAFNHFSQFPYIDKHGKCINLDPFIYFATTTHFLNHEGQQLVHKGQDSKLQEKTLGYLKWMADLYKPYTFSKCWFDCSNTRKLYDALSQDEKQMFHFDVECIDWEHYLGNVHALGLRKHVLKDHM